MFYQNAQERYEAEEAAREEAAAAVAADMANEGMWDDWGDEADVYAAIDAAEEAA